MFYERTVQNVYGMYVGLDTISISKFEKFSFEFT